jgi:hypothetical protein
MSTMQFDRDEMAGWYAQEHLKTDPGIVAVHYLPKEAGPREIRLVEVNRLMGSRTDASLEPIDFGVDMGKETKHLLVVLDVTPDQWERIERGDLGLPGSWSLEDAVHFPEAFGDKVYEPYPDE